MVGYSDGTRVRDAGSSGARGHRPRLLAMQGTLDGGAPPQPRLLRVVLCYCAVASCVTGAR